MPAYKASVKDARFLLYDVFDTESKAKELKPISGTTRQDWDNVLEEAAKFAERVVHPLMRGGDEEGCTLENGQVRMPKGWVDSFKLYVENGWPLLEAPEHLGGNPLPSFVRMCMQEYLAAANVAWGMPPGLTTAAIEVLEAHASDELKNKFARKMAEGQWFGTMCLTEAHCGTDLGLVRTRATPREDGSYELDGTKIFITAGDHDITENIIHLVLARLPDAPRGTKGISLFLVPKFLVDDRGVIGDFNHVTCSALEHKMGIKASPTCVINFEKSIGYLVGEINSGLAQMFTMMNIARIGTGIQGIGTAAASTWHAQGYAKERLQMRSLSGHKNPDGPADPIIVHPDVRRMLLTQKALTEGCRALVCYSSEFVDHQFYSDNEDLKKAAQARLGLLTPVIKGFSTEVAQEVTAYGVQILGGHGYICESGQEQLLRDARISTIYEGTTGVQALDFIGRKILLNQGRDLKVFTKEIHLFCESLKNDDVIEKTLIEPLAKKNKEWGDMTVQIGMRAMKNPDEVGAASVEFLMYSGYVILGYMWARMAVAAQKRLQSSPEDLFLQSKMATAQFYFARILPRTDGLRSAVLAGGETMMAVPEVFFGLECEA